jgi:CheY-like chemotaxis protein
MAVESGRDHVLSVRTSEVDGRALIVVEDTGPGIPEELHDRVFEPFFTTKARHEGTGLGLALSAEIVRQHGGHLTFESDPGRGTAFHIWLPLSSQSRPAVAVNASAPAPAEVPQHARILVVDDERMLLRAFHRTLSGQHDVVLAEGGAEALSVLSQDQDFDVILCDLMMPETDGIHVYQWMCANAPALVPRVIFVSGGAFTDRTQAFVSVTARDVLEKPVSSARLREAIQGLCNRTGSSRNA